jgi:hypothetical protein
MSLQRRINVTSRFNATLRWDIFNVFNRANFGLPDTNIVNAGRHHLEPRWGPRVISCRFASRSRHRVDVGGSPAIEGTHPRGECPIPLCGARRMA